MNETIKIMALGLLVGTSIGISLAVGNILKEIKSQNDFLIRSECAWEAQQENFTIITECENLWMKK